MRRFRWSWAVAWGVFVFSAIHLMPVASPRGGGAVSNLEARWWLDSGGRILWTSGLLTSAAALAALRIPAAPWRTALAMEAGVMASVTAILVAIGAGNLFPFVLAVCLVVSSAAVYLGVGLVEGLRLAARIRGRAGPSPPALGPRARTWVLAGVVAVPLLAWGALGAVNRYRDLIRLPGFGSAVAFVGDIDGDGIADFVVGAPGSDDRSGSAFVLSGKSGSVLYSVEGGAPGDEFGTALTGVGDVDRDGTPDFAVGARMASPNGLRFAGEVRVFSGRRGSLLRVLCSRATGWPPRPLGCRMGTSLAAAGDVDRDGVPDIIVGAPSASGVLGRAGVLSGGDGHLVLDLGPTRDDGGLGESVAGGVDFNGDGRPDLVVGAVGANRWKFSYGQGRIKVCSGADGSSLLSVDPPPREGAYEGESWGSSVQVLPDVDRDGVPDLMAAGNLFCGRVALFSGKSGKAIREWVPADDRSYEGFVPLTDLDGDSLPEVGFVSFVGVGDCPIGGSVIDALSSKGGTPLWTYTGLEVSGTGTFSAAGGPDIDGDGVPDLVVGEHCGWYGNNKRVRRGSATAVSGRDGHVIYRVLAPWF